MARLKDWGRDALWFGGQSAGPWDGDRTTGSRRMDRCSTSHGTAAESRDRTHNGTAAGAGTGRADGEEEEPQREEES